SVGIVESDRANHAQRLLEVFIGFAGKADDHISGESEVRNGSPQLVHALEIPLARIATQHSFERTRRPGLHREVHVLAHTVGLSHRPDHALAEVVRMWTGEAKPAHAP